MFIFLTGLVVWTIILILRISPLTKAPPVSIFEIGLIIISWMIYLHLKGIV